VAVGDAGIFEKLFNVVEGQVQQYYFFLVHGTSLPQKRVFNIIYKFFCCILV